MYGVKLTARAKRALKKLPESYKAAIALAIDELKEDPTLGKPLGRELTGKFSLRIGVLRIIYKVYKDDRMILVFNIDHRSKVYN